MSDPSKLAEALTRREREEANAAAHIWEDPQSSAFLLQAIRCRGRADAFREAVELLAAWSQGKLDEAAPADHACGYGLCPPWCPNRNPSIKGESWTKQG